MPDTIVVMTEEDLQNSERFHSIVFEGVKKLISDGMKKKLARPNVRKQMLEKYGPKAFLMPDKLKFPVVDPDTGKPNCGLIYAAMIRAKQFGYGDVAAKAKELYSENSCGRKISVAIQDSADPVEVGFLMDLLEIETIKETE